MANISAKKVTVYGILAVTALIFGYIEMLFPLSFIAPGVKLGIANTLSLYLVIRGNYKGAFLVNCVRILLGGLLFGGLFSLVFSFTAGMLSVLCSVAFSRLKIFGVLGISVAASTVHNLAQLVVASVVVGGGVWYYAPLLLLIGIITGIFTGLVAWLMFKYTKKIIF